MKKILLILCLLLCLLPLQAKKKAKVVIEPVHTLTVEENQRFLYYFYEVLRLDDAEEYYLAYNLAQFCYHLNPYDVEINKLMGDYTFGLGDDIKSLVYYNYALQHGGYDPGTAYRVYKIFRAVEDYERALQMLDMLRDNEGENEALLDERVLVYWMMDQPEKGLQAVEEYLKDNPYSEMALMLRVSMMEQTDAKNKRLQLAYEEALAVMPYHPTLLNNYAYWLCTHKGDLDKAETMSRHAVQQENNPTFLDTYAWILYKKGEIKAAQMYIQQAYDAYNNNRLGRPKEIEQHYKKIMKKK